VIFDEAHELEDVAGSYFGVAVSNLRVDELARDVEITMRDQGQSHAPASTLERHRPAGALATFLLDAAARRWPLRFREPAEFLEENGDEFLALQNALTQLA
jgi:ATP-dependent DNA helicase DinG